VARVENVANNRRVRVSALPSRLSFRLPARRDALGGWLARLLPELDRRSRRDWIAEGRITVDGRVQDRSDRRLPAGTRVEIALPERDSSSRGAEGEEPDERWARRLVAEGSGLFSGPCWAWIEDTPWWRGELPASAASNFGPSPTFEVEHRESGYARVRIEGEALTPLAVLEGLAGIGLPVVGDLLRGGLAVEGGPALAAEREVLRRPGESVWLYTWEDGDSRAVPDEGDEADLRVSDETARALASGHPWILSDEASDSMSGLRPGALIRVLDRRGAPLVWARVEGEGKLAARVWGDPVESLRGLPSIESRVARALALRRPGLAVDPENSGNTLRLIHGEADGFPGLYVDRLGSLLRVLVTGWAALGFRERTLAALAQQLPVSPEGHAWSVLELLHLRGQAGNQVDRVRWLQGGMETLRAAHPDLDAVGFVVRERGLDFRVDPGWDAVRRPRPGYGLFLDQRDNRERLAQRAVGGGRWLNLFAHTGSFSVALLAGGAEEVISVDLSAAYLERLEKNLDLNRARGLDSERHHSHRGDVRRYLEGLDPAERFRGVVIDPPTAAAAGRRFWSVREDLEPLLALCLARLEPGGHLFVSQNRSGAPLGLDRLLERIARRAHRSVDAICSAPPAADNPTLRGFPEGESFEGWLLDLR
jgi:23S rRNA (cytosine1962-C5)-methyltransferase